MSSELNEKIVAADLLPVQRRATPLFRVARAVIGTLLRLVFQYRVIGRENLPRDRPYVLICNHLNWIDPWSLLVLWPAEPRVHFLANPENLIGHRVHWAFVRAVGGYIPVDLRHGSGPTLFRHVDRCLSAGGVVAIFPEASYGPREGELQPFKRGFAHFAEDNRVPVVPVTLSGTKELWLRRRIEVRVGPPLEPGAGVDAMFEMARARMEAQLPPYIDPGGTKPFRDFLTHLLY